MKALINRLAGAAYRRVFNREMSAAEGDFLRSLSWVGAGTFIATGLTALFSVLGGRLLGPEEYGTFTLVQSIAMFLSVPMLMGFSTAMLKYNAESDDAGRQKRITSTSYIMIAGLVAVSVTVMVFLAEPLSKLFAATPGLFRLSVYFALLYSVFTLGQTTLRSVRRMRAFALSQPIHAVILLLSFGVLILLEKTSFTTMVYSNLIALAVTGFAIHVRCSRRYLTSRFDKAWAHALTRFAAATVVSLLAIAFYGNIGKIVVAHYMTVADVGVYGAYFTSTLSTANILWQVFNMVFLPTASRYTDKHPLFRRINRLVPVVIVLGTPLIMGIGHMILVLYGEAYVLNLSWLALLATAAVLFIVRGFYASLLISDGPRGASVTSVAAVVTAVVMLALSLLLVPQMGLSGAMVAIIAAHLVGIMLLYGIGRKVLQSG